MLKVYGRSYCTLCADMMAALQALQPRYGYQIEWVDIEGIEELEDRYGETVPVLVAAGQELCHYRLEVARLDAYFPQMR